MKLSTFFPSLIWGPRDYQVPPVGLGWFTKKRRVPGRSRSTGYKTRGVMNDPSREKNWKIISSIKKNLNILIFFLIDLKLIHLNAKRKIVSNFINIRTVSRSSPTGGTWVRNELYGNFFGLRPVVSYGGGRIGDGIPQKKNWLREVRRRQMERPRKLAEWAEKRVGSTHTHEQQLCSRNYSVVERMTDDGPLAASTLGVGDESRDLCARRSVVTCEKKIQFFIGSFHFAEFLIGQRRVIGGNIFFFGEKSPFFFTT